MDASVKEKMLENLTVGQRESVETLDKDLEIIACAGAGKTKTVTLRIINLIDSGVSPENIVAITFTRKAATEMKSRIYKAGEEYLGNTIGFAGMFIGTIDSFCLRMLQEYEPKYAKYSVLDEVQTKIFIEKHFKRSEADPIGLFGSVIDEAYNLNDPERYSQKINYHTALMSMLNNSWFDKKARSRWNNDTKTRLAKYNKCLLDNKYFDFSLLVREIWILILT